MIVSVDHDADSETKDSLRLRGSKVNSMCCFRNKYLNKQKDQ